MDRKSLCLYYSALSYCSQKVPVLKHGRIIVHGPLQILGHLERVYVKSPTLEPDLMTSEGQLIQRFGRMCRDIRIDRLSCALELLPDLVEDHRVPDFFHQYITKMMYQTKGVVTLLHSKADGEDPDLIDFYHTLGRDLLNTFQFVHEDDARERVLSEITQCQRLFDAAEVQLQKNIECGQRDMWLCSESFSLADIEYAVLMRWLVFMGLANTTWRDGKHALLEKYYQKLCERKTFQDCCLNIDPYADVWRFRLRRNIPWMLKTLAVVGIVAYFYGKYKAG